MKRLFPLLIVLFFQACHPEIHSGDTVLRHVGDILYDPAIDTTDFAPCHEDLVYQYYNFSSAIMYEGEKIKIIREFEEKFKPVDDSINGYVSVRFIVNCQGETGWFRLTIMDRDYTETELPEELTDQILAITMGLSGWKKAEFDGDSYDYYQYLTFKITRGDIERIMP